ncbi:MAG: hypothetical protein RJB47_1284 [Pseudomonadota bacterium]|jgi:uncharacterized protein (DUF4415 family)
MSKILKTKSGRLLQLPNDAEDAVITEAATSDPDAPVLTDAQWTQVLPLLKRGRPLGSGQKTQVTLRIDTDVLNKFKATGAGWQRRINDALKTVKI